MNFSLLDIILYRKHYYLINLVDIQIGSYRGSLFCLSFEPDDLDYAGGWSYSENWWFDILFLRQLVMKIKEWRRNDN